MAHTRTKLGSYTENGQSYPGYVTAFLEEGDEYVTISVRSPSRSTGAWGATASLTVPVDIFSDFLKEVNGVYARLCNPELSK